MIQINSFSELKDAISGKDKAYLLLYKKGTEQSECAFGHIAEGSENVEGLNLYYADVTMVRDIHTEFGITSVPTLLEFENGSFKNVVKGCNNAGHYKALFEDAVYFAEVKKEGKPQKRVTVYSTPTCSWCNTLKTYLKNQRVRYTDVDVSRDPKAAEELVRRTGQQGVPQTDINGEIIVGFNKARINELLGLQG
ncbi:glutaredoxin family protein [Saccharicrinis sp. FJH2]|uniref:glutaredoxin family protein n=1 Tax=Saccharicrinis sp. FJH65 TaxID=3344659 RepID=UPI0035F4ECD2